ncbi:uncharacterized protein UV8b_04269 [Ustilaginoidea virens]|uniref:Uncharacterized protein n=1 Tax=Ustilaginoidea virens TaxID=1159556 RepID=A0A8E5MH01_USTVR|nr:uncharacterized protein UV8b_04269 [Ustilaginoidea virens]QUC20028.1 hypothetical protein UV8b_04269 [Ustilaginoidea virens]
MPSTRRRDASPGLGPSASLGSLPQCREPGSCCLSLGHFLSSYRAEFAVSRGDCVTRSRETGPGVEELDRGSRVGSREARSESRKPSL